MAYKATSKTETRKDEKRRLIFETAAKVFAERGYHQTTVKDITETAKISVGTFYLYFKNKEDLFEKLYDEMEQLINRIKNYAYEQETEIAAERYANVMAASVWTYQTYKELSRIMLIEAVGLNPRFEEKYADIMVRSCEGMEATIKHLKDLGIVDVPDTKLAALACEGSFNHAITYWLRSDDKSDLKTYTFPLTIYSLQALKISYRKEDIERSIAVMFQKLDNTALELTKFR
jgi:AcrR family transcriptional regulator